MKVTWNWDQKNSSPFFSCNWHIYNWKKFLFCLTFVSSIFIMWIAIFFTLYFIFHLFFFVVVVRCSSLACKYSPRWKFSVTKKLANSRLQKSSPILRNFYEWVDLSISYYANLYFGDINFYSATDSFFIFNDFHI